MGDKRKGHTPISDGLILTPLSPMLMRQGATLNIRAETDTRVLEPEMVLGLFWKKTGVRSLSTAALASRGDTAATVCPNTLKLNYDVL